MTYAQHTCPLSSEGSLADSTPIAELLTVELSLTTTKVCRSLNSNTQTSAYGANALTDCAIAAVLNSRSFNGKRNDEQVGSNDEMFNPLTLRFAFTIFEACFMTNLQVNELHSKFASR